jgi:TolB-like protein
LKPSTLFSTTVKTIFAVGLVLGVGACKVKPRPPVFSLYGFQRLAMAPFENLSTDPQMARDLQNGITQQILRLGACPVVESDLVAKYLNGGSPADDPNLLKKCAAQFKSDIVMTGTVESYQEFQEMGEPKRVVNNTKTGAAEWGFYVNRKVEVAVTAKLLDPATGSTYWTQRATGNSYFNKWTPLPIPGDVVTPQSYVLQNAMKLVMREVNKTFNDRDERRGTRLRYMDNATFSDLRQRAVANAAGYLTSDFRGHGAWTPGMEVK